MNNEYLCIAASAGYPRIVMLLIKKRTAPYSYFCVPHPQKNVFE